jgi:hypothetical protein
MADVASAKVETAVETKDRELDELKWTPDGRGFLTTSQAGATPLPLHMQIGFIPIPGGEYRPITKDTNAYRTLSLSAEGKTMAAIQQKAAQTLYLFPAEGFTGTPPTPTLAQSKESHFFEWAGNSGVYFDGNLTRVSMDGSSRTTIVADPAEHIFKPGACQTGGSINFVWQGHPESSKTNIWRVDADGTNLKQLT